MFAFFCLEPVGVIRSISDIDHLIESIKRDRLYHVVDVRFDTKDSALLIVVRNNIISTQYLDTTYNLHGYESIAVVLVENSRHYILERFGKRGDRLVALFRQKWCTANECMPLSRLIKETACPSGPRPKFTGVDVRWDRDSLFHVDQHWEGSPADCYFSRTWVTGAFYDMNGVGPPH